ncbi:MAG: sialidase family protein, partial [Thermoplasmata archaeon]
MLLALIASGIGLPLPGATPVSEGSSPGALRALPAGAGGFLGGAAPVYFNSAFLPRVPSSAGYCPSGVCTNLTDDPSINLTSTGRLVVAYTAFTDGAACAADRPFAQSEVAVVTSSNLGANWSAPVYLGNPLCNGTTPTGFPDAWEPSVTSLPNGSIVVVYDELNVSKGTLLPQVALGPSTWSIPDSRIVVARSFNGGANWTDPLVIDNTSDAALNGAGAIALRPWATASGRTVYVSWMRLKENAAAAVSPTTYQYVQTGIENATSFLSASSDGGFTFPAPL